MKRVFLLALVCVLLAAPLAEASWSWWAPTVPNIQNPSWGQPSWPTPSPNPNPNPRPDPKPNPSPNPSPGTPILPSQPSNPGAKVPLPSSSLTSDEQSLINQVNQERAKHGLNALKIDYSLVALAKQKSHDMAVNNYFSHVSPTLGTVYTMLDRAGVSYSRAGENIARTGSVSRAHPLFMNSAGHRANILHSGYTHIGVGIVKQGTSYHITQIFIKR